MSRQFVLVPNNSTFSKYKDDIKEYQTSEYAKSQRELICWFHFEHPREYQTSLSPSFKIKPDCLILYMHVSDFRRRYEVNLEEVSEIISTWMDILLITGSVYFIYYVGIINDFQLNKPHPFSQIKGKYTDIFAAIIDYDNLYWKYRDALILHRVEQFNGRYLVSVPFSDIAPEAELDDKITDHITKHQKSLFLHEPSLDVMYYMVFHNPFNFPIKFKNNLCEIITAGLANSNNPWSNFLTRGLYDPRLFLIIYAFYEQDNIKRNDGNYNWMIEKK